MSERDMKRLVALLARRFGLTYMDVADWLRRENGLDDIERRIASGDWMTPLAKLDDAAIKIASELQEGYVTAGQQAAEWLDGKIPEHLIAFDTTDNAVVRRARANQLELVVGFREEAAQTRVQIVRRAMVEGARGGVNPRRVAQDFKDSIGLTPHQEQAVANYRRSLESRDYSRALSYELSDGNVDRTVRTAMRDDKALTPAQVDAAVEKYRKNAVAHRATTIARTEALKNANEGAADALKQAVERGQVDVEELVTTWHSGPNTPGARDSHQALDGVSVRFGEDFELPGGVRMKAPGDPRGGPENVISCRCTASTAYG